MLKKLLIVLGLLGAIPAYAVDSITQFPPGFALQDGSHLNKMVDAINNLTGNGTAGPVVGTTGVFSSTVTTGSAGIVLGSTPFSEANLALYAKGVAAGYKVARGTTSLDGSNPTSVDTGLATVVSCNTNIVTSTALGVSTAVLTYTVSTATLNIYGWKPTDATNNTLIASTGTDNVAWICVGT